MLFTGEVKEFMTLLSLFCSRGVKKSGKLGHFEVNWVLSVFHRILIKRQDSEKKVRTQVFTHGSDHLPYNAD